MDSFSSLMEFAVAIAGFSGIKMAVQARNAVVNEVQSFRNTNLIAFSLSAAFGSVIGMHASRCDRVPALVLVERVLRARVWRAADRSFCWAKPDVC